MKDIILEHHIMKTLLDKETIRKCMSDSPESYPDWVYAKGYSDAITLIVDAIMDYKKQEGLE